MCSVVARLFAAIVIVLPLGAPSVFAQSGTDPFRDAPAPPPMPVPRPRPAPAPQPAVVMPPPAPVPPPPDPAKRFDGIWTGLYTCLSSRAEPQFDANLTAQIKGGQFSILTERQPGMPGYWNVNGTVAPDNTINLSGEAISRGAPGQSPNGTHVPMQFTGRFNGDELTTSAATNRGGRTCIIRMHRRQ